MASFSAPLASHARVNPGPCVRGLCQKRYDDIVSSALRLPPGYPGTFCISMSGSIWHKVAGLSGAAAVGLGAYGAHAFKPQDPYFLEVFDRGNKYHLMHSLLLAAAPLARRPSAVGACTTAGILLFSGSCYAAAFTEDRANAKLAPFGGISLIAAWLCLLL